MTPEVWVLFPSTSNSISQARGVRKAIRQICQDRNWNHYERPTTEYQKIPLVDASDFKNIYRRMHRTRVAVVSIQAPAVGGPQIRMRPMPKHGQIFLKGRELMSVRQLSRHKAFFLRLRWDRDHQTWASTFASWMNRVECDGIQDPRCVPFQVFLTARHWSKTIAGPAGRRRFDSEHGGATRRTDTRGLVWMTGTNHGLQQQDALQIAGNPLPIGFHWDVQAEQEVELWTPTEGWLIRKYLNVTPDASIRGQEPKAVQIRLR